MMAECPLCGSDVQKEPGMVVGELFECPDCGIELEVIKLNPFKVSEAPQEEEDWGE
ncbi:MAG: lysine biosynthesis protein LysW [Bacteroidetes bacterium]|nr:lysine biosynthesis protein LysW [Bacteroidota bacterium]MBU1116093.1 lysine biosynthesis protein LysW [Bacteroidota bacterium]MBU1799483.1 lysine biosynthesis protein LysW [Bacteroidota bacterium]